MRLHKLHDATHLHGRQLVMKVRQTLKKKHKVFNLHTKQHRDLYYRLLKEMSQNEESKV